MGRSAGRREGVDRKREREREREEEHIIMTPYQIAVMCLVLAASASALPTRADMQQGADSDQQQVADNYIEQPNNIHHLIQANQAEVLEDMGVSKEEAWNCGWYGNDVPRAAVAIAACKDYLETRLLSCVPWTKQYGEAHPKASRHISLDEVHIKCKHVKDTLDQKTELPGDTGSCVWCMNNVNTN